MKYLETAQKVKFPENVITRLDKLHFAGKFHEFNQVAAEESRGKFVCGKAAAAVEVLVARLNKSREELREDLDNVAQKLNANQEDLTGPNGQNIAAESYRALTEKSGFAAHDNLKQIEEDYGWLQFLYGLQAEGGTCYLRYKLAGACPMSGRTHITKGFRTQEELTKELIALYNIGDKENAR